MKNKMEHNTFTTSDFYTAVYLLTRDYKLVRINKENPRRFGFVFADHKDRAELLEDFFNGKAMIEPRQFIASIKELKSMMYSDAL